MKKKSLCLLAFASMFMGITTLSNANYKLPPKDTTVIVELKDLYGETSEGRKAVRGLFYNELNSKVTTNYSLEYTLDELANYVILKVNSSDIYYINQLETVTCANKEKYYKTLEEDSSLATTESETKSFNPKDENGPDKNYSRIEMNVKESNSKEGEGVLIAVLDNSFQLDHECYTDLSASEVKYTEAQMKELTSNSKLNAKADSKGDLYYNNKIPFHYDYANNDTDVLNTSENHGVHVSSIAAANGTYTGIAPKAQLALMKVFPDSGSGASDSTVLRALNDCAKLGVDVINMSLGSSLYDSPEDRASEESAGSSESDYTYNTAFRAFKKLTERGVQFAVSAGNEGRGNYVKDSERTSDYGLYPNLPTDQAELGILGSYANSSYASIVASARLSDDTSLSDAGYYRKKVSGFSSDGVTYDLKLNPDIITPGENIWGATVYTKGSSAGKYVYMNGTSMAAPNYAGAVANVLSNGNYTNEEERKAYQLTLERRIQSTASPLTQEVAGRVTGFYTPRKQGAGMPNIAHAIDTQVYLEGVRNKAKIELENNEFVKVGRLKFDFKAINESQTTKEYTAKMYVQCPSLSSDKSYATLFDQTLETFTQDVTIAPGTNTISFDKTISDASKEILKEFDQGTYLEGYIILTPKDTSDEITLSIPFLGYYGDYGQATPVEPFDFEQKENKLYGSDLLNSAYSTFKSKPNADFTSMIAMREQAFTTSEISSFASGSENPIHSGAIAAKVNSETNAIDVGLKGLSDNLLIQQYVYRTCTNNTVKLINKKNNLTVLNTKMKSVSDNGTYSQSSGFLFKSLFADSSDLEAPKAYLAIQLRDAKGDLIYDAGEYTLEFTYVTAYGSTVKKSYTLNIVDGTASSPKLENQTLTGNDNTDRVVRFDVQDNIVKATVNNAEVEVLSDTSGKYISLNVKDYTSRGKILITLENSYGLSTSLLYSIKDIENGYGVQYSSLNLAYNPSFKVTEGKVDETTNTFTNKYVTKINDARGNDTGITGYTVLMYLPYYAKTEGIKVIETLNKEQVELAYEINGNLLSYVTTKGNVEITFSYDSSKPDPDQPVTPETPDTPTDEGGLSLGAIIGISIAGVALVAIATFGIILYVKKAKRTK